MKDQIILTPITKQSLISELLTGVAALLDEKKEHKPEQHTEYITGKEVETILKISTQTRYDWGKKGILKPYKIGSRTRYKRDEVYSALIALETRSV